MTGAQIERARNLERRQHLSRLSKQDYSEWLEILKDLDTSRMKIKRAMGFAFDKIESAEEIVSTVKDRLVIASQHAAVKIAGLYLLSDLLHNSASPVKMATNYK